MSAMLSRPISPLLAIPYNSQDGWNVVDCRLFAIVENGVKAAMAPELTMRDLVNAPACVFDDQLVMSKITLLKSPRRRAERSINNTSEWQSAQIHPASLLVCISSSTSFGLSGPCGV